MSLDITLYANECPDCGRSDEVYSGNITHNLTAMASEAGIYYAMCRPEEIGIKIAGELVQLLESGLAALLDNPKKFKEFNPDNGWGSYDGLVEFVGKYLDACRKYPQATIDVWR